MKINKTFSHLLSFNWNWTGYVQKLYFWGFFSFWFLLISRLQSKVIANERRGIKVNNELYKWTFDRWKSFVFAFYLTIANGCILIATEIQLKMIRTQSVVVKNKKKSQSSSSRVNKTKGAKSNISDKNKSQINAVENRKPDDKLLNKVQGHTQIENEIHSTKPKSQAIDLGDRKLERSNSFFLSRKLSRIYDSLTNSRESLKDNNVSSDNDKKPPFKFIRSVSLAAISLKKDYRNSMRKPRLEQLSEEDHPLGAPVSQSKRKNDKKASTASIDSLSSRTSEKSSIISSFKRTFSLTPSRRKSANPKWSASLMNLQQIDVMISYEDLSFIDYDKFNTYEENLMTKMKSSNQIDVNRLNADQFPGVKMRSRADDSRRRHSTIIQPTIGMNEDSIEWLNVNSTRWSNPCIGPNITECASSFPSYASMVKAHPAVDIDDCDCSASNNCFIETNANSTHATQSVDDLTVRTNEFTDFGLQAVSFICSNWTQSFLAHESLGYTIFRVSFGSNSHRKCIVRNKFEKKKSKCFSFRI